MLNNNINHSNYSPSFQAALRITVPVEKKFSTRVRNIQQSFLNETKNQRGNLSLTKIDGAGNSDYFYLGCDPSSSTVITVKTPFNTMLKKLSDQEIVSKMVKIFKSLRGLDKHDLVVAELESEINRLSNKQVGFLNISRYYKDKGDSKTAESFRYASERFGIRLDALKKEKDAYDKNFLNKTKEITGDDGEVFKAIKSSMR